METPGGGPKWPPTEGELVHDLDMLRKVGLGGRGSRAFVALERAASLLGHLHRDSTPDLDAVLRDGVSAFREGPNGAAVRLLYGLDAETRGLRHPDRELAAARALGVLPRQFQRSRRAPLLLDLARAVLRLLDAVPLAVEQEVYGSDEDYESAFKSWHQEAWVRSKPRNLDAFEPDKEFFSRSLAPILLCEEAITLSPADVRAILVHHLYNYLEFTVRLEMGPVNDICMKIRDGKILPWLPTRMRDDVIRVYTDEAGHAEMSNDLRRRVQQHTGIVPIKSKPAFLKALERLQGDRSTMEHDFVTLFFVIVSETLITGSLKKLPNDRTVQSAVRNVANDHARDEGRHHRFFSQVLRYVWPKLPGPIRHEALVLLPHLLHAFLGVDESTTRKMLDLYPATFPNPGEALGRIVEHPSVRKGIQASAAPTLHLLENVGVFAESGARDLFAQSGFALGSTE